jgi:glycogen operon protein
LRRRTQRGNNNAYCQDNSLSWFDWKLVETHEGLERFVRTLVAFRRGQPAVRRVDFPNGEPLAPGGLPEVLWFGPDGRKKDWRANCPSLTCFFAAPHVEPNEPAARHVLLLMHAGGQPRDFTVPTLPKPISWRVFVDTRLPSPEDIYPDLDGALLLPSGRLCLEHHSMIALVSNTPGPWVTPPAESSPGRLRRAGQ